jgi:hypothetical protein
VHWRFGIYETERGDRSCQTLAAEEKVDAQKVSRAIVLRQQGVPEKINVDCPEAHGKNRKTGEWRHICFWKMQMAG